MSLAKVPFQWENGTPTCWSGTHTTELADGVRSLQSLWGPSLYLPSPGDSRLEEGKAKRLKMASQVLGPAGREGQCEPHHFWGLCMFGGEEPRDLFSGRPAAGLCGRAEPYFLTMALAATLCIVHYP